ncbi:MAG: CBS domain-containing protein, partial [Planctomycetota bacterium]
ALPANARAGLVLVGMGGVFAACTKTPIGSLVLVSEITGSYGLVVPLMMTCASAYLLSRSFTMNVEQVPGIGDSPAHRGDFLVNVLEGIKVDEAMIEQRKAEVFHADTPFHKVLERIKVSAASVFPIVDEKDCLVGLFSLSDIRQIMNEQAVGHLVVAGDLGTTDVAWVTLDTNLDQALKLFTQKNLDAVPVVERLEVRRTSMTSISTAVRPPRGPVGNMRVVGMLTRRDLISAYHRRLHALQRADELDKRASQLLVEMPGPAADPALEPGTQPQPPAPTDASRAGPDLLAEPLENK